MKIYNIIMNRMRVKHFFVIALQLSLLLICSCEKDKVTIEEFGSISGYVFDAKTNSPLQNANISTSPASAALLTDANGYFYIPEVLAGDVSVSAKKNE
ncbi:carboxypeptidase-like regulatory domain-containing protein [Bacteroidota bacterium]